ncbi:MAG: hypothetical protein UU47_C0020G0011 [candidate division TM6 bacterium GW2011_GWE2_41_16]|nr:MAG: hypothetical protein UU47_C0020G0011 [candidate division TM6 bacterium GW2011_GWE2_41_16]
MTTKKIIFNSDHICLESHSSAWVDWYAQERAIIHSCFAPNRVLGMEHYGSTSIQGMCAKPIVDILVGITTFELLDTEKTLLAKIGYEFIERSSFCERFYLIKRGEKNFNLAVVLHEDDLWNMCLATREYLKIHPDVQATYTRIKNEAIAQGYTTIDAYSRYKRNFINALSKEALQWQSSRGERELPPSHTTVRTVRYTAVHADTDKS